MQCECSEWEVIHNRGVEIKHVHPWLSVCVCVWHRGKGYLWYMRRVQREWKREGRTSKQSLVTESTPSQRERERSRMCLCVFVESSCEWLRIAQGTVLLDSRWMDKCVCVAAGHEGLNNETDKISQFTVWRSLRCHMSTYWCLSLIISYLSGLTDDHRMWSL